MRIYTYSIPISTPLLPIAERRGLIFETKQGLGEAAPLPGWSKETILNILASIEDPSAFPSAAFGMKCLECPFPRSFPSIPLAALATNISEAENALNNGFKTLKIKVGHYSIPDALDLVWRVQRPHIQLRIDINRRWSFDEALLFFNQLDPEGIEYIEEPTSDLRQLHQLPALPIALDETLREPANNWIQLCNLHAFILKPTLLGSRLDFLIQLGQKLQKKLVFSSSFESAVGLLHIAHLHARFSMKTAVGLDTHRFFMGNFFPMPVKNGMLCDTSLPPLDRSWLKKYVP